MARDNKFKTLDDAVADKSVQMLDPTKKKTPSRKKTMVYREPPTDAGFSYCHRDPKSLTGMRRFSQKKLSAVRVHCYAMMLTTIIKFIAR